MTQILLVFCIFLLFSTCLILFQIQSYLQLLKKKGKSSFFRNDDGKLKWIMIFVSLSSFFGLTSLIWFIYKIYNDKLLNNNSTENILSKWGQFGDFIGGFVGIFFTIVGVLLLYETLSLQRQELKESRSVFEKQRFEDTFFKLISVYQDIIKDMSFVDSIGNISSGIDYFNEQKKLLLNNFTPTFNIFQANKKAIHAYELFYILNKDNIAHYYRTLYRIFRFIDTAPFEFEDKMRYAKTARALMSESELFFLYYNAQTDYGKNFIILINNYNLLKHLPILEKLEFKWLSVQFDMEMLMSMSQLLYEVKKDCVKIFTKKQKVVKSYFGSHIQISIKLKKNEIRLQILIRKNIPATNTFQKGYGLLNLSENDLREMLFNFLHDIIEFENFREINKAKIKYEKYTMSNTSKAIIWVNAKTEAEFPIINYDKY